MQKIIQLTAENIMRLKAVHITPDGNSIVIGGRNAQGKTSILNAIEMALGGKKSIPGKPIRDGEKNAKIVLELDNLIVTRTFTQGGSNLVVTSKDGAKYSSPQAMLDDLVGKLSLDPLAFKMLKPGEQATTLRELVGIDTTELDAKRRAIFDERTDANREMKKREAQLAGMNLHEGVPEQEVSVSDLVNQINDANSRNKKIESGRAEVDNNLKKMADIESQIEELNRRYGQLESENEDLVASVEALGEPFDTMEIEAQIANAEDTNRKVRENAQYHSVDDELSKDKHLSELLTKQLAEIDQQKAELLASAKYPIDGIGIDDDGLMTYNGIPFTQASAAEQLRVSAAIGLALNPKLGVLCIRDASLLDSESLAELERFAVENDAQLWIERVGNGDEVTIQIEDGLIVEQPVAN